jgi:CDP-glycerol glycerophosphotransferase (TagB/SpsB family)
MFENVESMMPGFKANSFDQLLEFIDQLNLGMDNYRADRQIANKKFNKYNDNKNSYRLLKSIGILD